MSTMDMERRRETEEKRKKLTQRQGGAARVKQVSAADEEEAAYANLDAETQMLRNRMEVTHQVLVTSSNVIKKSEDQYGIFGTRLREASAVLADLKRRADEDSRYIWMSFLFLMCVCGYIFLKRLGILWAIFKTIYTAFGIASWATGRVGDVTGSVWQRGTGEGGVEMAQEAVGVPGLLVGEGEVDLSGVVGDVEQPVDVSGLMGEGGADPQAVIAEQVVKDYGVGQMDGSAFDSVPLSSSDIGEVSRSESAETVAESNDLEEAHSSSLSNWPPTTHTEL
uniref:Sec20 C-terminal domain-containing protein n=1 Tax=Chromera velia CCMP2878 TaxID=1169474 RepID=A0A0G4HCM8_9ALVE|eukprot:Cvel_26237.t1-p1 / transcript=Cvel_26237.t1 / gene=Cvel_26237 / organism=Chromera_velia_CCMP2878 / gene_product=hypothetical protein / transcript_product=hypothetical protein / location=Cvel_scaffold3093:9005-11426(+) / protein_length=279 / sequence_SO=supercontig / SO=protein_coding / is_pseudo=false